MSDAQVATVKERVFDGMETFYVTKVDQTFVGTIFRGNLRGDNSSTSYASVQQKVRKEPTLNGFSLVLIDDPIAQSLQELEDGVERRPVYLALPTEVSRIRARSAHSPARLAAARTAPAVPPGSDAVHTPHTALVSTPPCTRLSGDEAQAKQRGAARARRNLPLRFWHYNARFCTLNL